MEGKKLEFHRNNYIPIKNLVNMYFNDFSANKLYYISNHFKQTFILPEISQRRMDNLLQKNYKLPATLNEYDAYKLIKNFIVSTNPYTSNKSNNYVFNIPKSKNCQLCDGIYKIIQSYDNAILNDIDYIIHGSYADNTYTEFSDVDDIIFLNEGVFSSFENFKKTKQLLSELNLFYQRVDPLQHHGHWIYTFIDKYDYDQSIMPVSIFDTAIAIGKNIELTMCVNNEYNSNFNEILETIVEEVKRDTELLLNGKCNLYYFKHLISSISLLVPLSFQVKGKIYDKKNAILKANELFDSEALEVIQWSTMIRENWSTLQHFNRVKYFIYLQKIFKNRNLLEYLTKKILPPINPQLVPGFDDLLAKKIIKFADKCIGFRNETCE